MIDPVENDVAHADLAVQRLIAAFGEDNVGQPIEIVRVVVLIAGDDGARAAGEIDVAAGGIPLHLSVKSLGQHAHGDHDSAVFRIYPVGDIQVTAIGHQIFAVGIYRHRQPFGGHSGMIAFPGHDSVRAQGRGYAAQGDISGLLIEGGSRGLDDCVIQKNTGAFRNGGLLF